MAPARQSLRDRLRPLKIWCRDHVRLNREPTNIPGTDAGSLTPGGTTEADAGRSEVVHHPATPTAKKNQPHIAGSSSGNTAPEPRIDVSTDAEQNPLSVNSRQAAASKAPSTIDSDEEELTTKKVTAAAEGAAEGPSLERLQHLEIRLRESETPIWLSSITKFKNDHPKEYELIANELQAVQHLKSVDSWDTWLNSRSLNGDSKDVTRRWLRKCKAYMPSVTLIRSLAMSLSNLDPYKIAPPITAGIFILVEVGHCIS